MKLIDKDALVAKIENISDYVDEHWDTDYAIGAKRFADKLQDAIDTLEVKEVDLEKEIDRVWDNTSDNFSENGWKEFEDIAKHFFELGLQARTDKELVKEVYSHIDSIKNTADKMTSGNFMHNRAAIKFSANTIAKVLELIGLKAQKGE